MPSTDSSLAHPAFFYDSLDGFLEAMAPYVAAGVDDGDTVFVAARGDYLDPLRDALGERRHDVMLEDTYEWFPHPATRLPAFHDFVTRSLSFGASRIRLAGEPVWPATNPELTREWQRYESVLNAVLAPYPVSLVCLYDESMLDEDILATARVTHPYVHTEGPSATFSPPEEFLADRNHTLSRPPTSAYGWDDTADFGSARSFLKERASLAGLSELRAGELCLAANEILTNGFMHAGRASMITWVAGGSFVCQIHNDGPALSDPLAGYRPPADDDESGRGLWLARQLVDLLLIVPEDTGTTFRLYVSL